MPMRDLRPLTGGAACEAFLMHAQERPYGRLTLTAACEAAWTSRRTFYSFEGLLDGSSRVVAAIF